MKGARGEPTAGTALEGRRAIEYTANGIRTAVATVNPDAAYNQLAANIETMSAKRDRVVEIGRAHLASLAGAWNHARVARLDVAVNWNLRSNTRFLR